MLQLHCNARKIVSDVTAHLAQLSYLWGTGVPIVHLQTRVSYSKCPADYELNAHAQSVSEQTTVNRCTEARGNVITRYEYTYLGS